MKSGNYDDLLNSQALEDSLLYSTEHTVGLNQRQLIIKHLVEVVSSQFEELHGSETLMVSLAMLYSVIHNPT